MARKSGVAALALLACGVALHANWDVRASSASRALTRAETTPDAAARDAALATADKGLKGAAPTGDLRDLHAVRALLGEAPDLDAAADWSHAALAASPARAEAFARLAYIDVVEDGRLDPEGAAALADSFLVRPFASDAFWKWRMEFTLARWDAIDEGTRAAALSEADVAARGVWQDHEWLAALADRLPPEPAAALRRAIEY